MKKGPKFTDITAAVLPTPLIELRGYGGRVFGKAEYLLPSGSIKHRSVPRRIAALLERGVILPGQPLIIHSAGSAAMAAAWAGARLGMQVHAMLPRSLPAGLAAILRWHGATLHTVASQDAQAYLAALKQETQGYFLDQFADVEIPACYAEIADELILQLGSVDAVVIGIGTGGSISGIAHRLKQLAPHCQVVGVEPEEAQLTRGKPWAPHDISGLAPPFTSKLYDPTLVHSVVPVSSAAAWSFARRLAQRDGLRIGPAAGAAAAVACRLAAQGPRHVVAILSGALEGLLTEERIDRYPTIAEDAA